MRLTDLPALLRAAGLTVVEVVGWQTRGVEMVAPIGGVICHHTASAAGSGECPSLGIVTRGRPASGKNPALPGPLAQVLLGRSGACYVVASGKANHAGAGAYPSIPAGDGSNAHLIGIEAENSGVGEPWPIVQMDAYVRMCAALADHYELGAAQIVAHYEWRKPKGEKIDPAGPWIGGGDWYSGGRWTWWSRSATADTFRVRVAAAMRGDDEMTPELEALLRQGAADSAYCKHLLDDVIRPKLDSVYVDTHATDHPELLAGMVAELHSGAAPPKI